jgi:hypothetical protein
MVSYREAFSLAGIPVSDPRLSWRSRGPAGNLSQVPGNRGLCVRKVRKVGKVILMTGTAFLTFPTFLA